MRAQSYRAQNARLRHGKGVVKSRFCPNARGSTPTRVKLSIIGLG